MKLIYTSIKKQVVLIYCLVGLMFTNNALGQNYYHSDAININAPHQNPVTFRGSDIVTKKTKNVYYSINPAEVTSVPYEITTYGDTSWYDFSHKVVYVETEAGRELYKIEIKIWCTKTNPDDENDRPPGRITIYFMDDPDPEFWDEPIFETSIDILQTQSLPTAGAISCPNDYVYPNVSPGSIIGSSSIGGVCDGNYTYQWERRLQGSGSWTIIENENGINYTNCPPLQKATEFRRKVIDCNGKNSPYSNVVAIGIEPLPQISNITPSNGENYIVTHVPQTEFSSISTLLSSNLDQVRTKVQYFDGLGRPEQNVSVCSSPSYCDIVQPFVYDNYGREKHKLLPYVLSSVKNLGQIQTNPNMTSHDTYSSSQHYKFYKNDNDNIVNDPYPYSEVLYEDSPLDRVVELGAPGASWQLSTSGINGSGHTVKTSYKTNVKDKVIRFDVKGSDLINNGYYLDNELYKTVTKNENWTNQSNSDLNKLNTIEEFKNRLGEVVLKRGYVKNHSGNVVNVDTYYIYDGYGLLRFVLPPEAIKQLTDPENNLIGDLKVISGEKNLYSKEDKIDTYLVAAGGRIHLKNGFAFSASPGKTLSITAGHVSTELLFSYKYDGRKRMIEKKIPGAAPVYLVYDDRDRLVATQDGEMRKNGEWLFTKYDHLNRPIITGKLNNGIKDQASMQDDITDFYNDNNHLYYETRSNKHSSTYSYTNNQSFPIVSTDKWLTVTYYDTYGYGGCKSFQTANNISDETTYNNKVHGQITGTRTKVLDGNEFTASAQWMVSTSYYDDKYQVIQAISDLYPANSGNSVVLSTNYDFVGKIENTKQVHSFEGTTKTIEERYNYDHAGRLLETYHSIDGATEVLLTKNEYNEIGELTHKFVGGENETNCAQTTDYQYNIRGWLTQLNNPNVTNDTKRKFGMQLHYNDALNGLINPAQYNGNISAIEWRTPRDASIGSPSDKQAYGFTYDALNRLTAADYGEGASFTSNTDAFNVSGIKYDLNGNIQNLTRERDIETANAVFDKMQIDNLTYKYAGNQLLSVSDGANSKNKDKNNINTKDYGFKDGASSALEYKYDLNGNMVSDANKGMTAVEYNHLNLPKLLTGTDNNTISYIYNANGQKLAKTADGTTTYYFGNIVYEEAELQYILHSEGKYDLTNSSGQYQFDIKDHLGNVRVVVDIDGNELQQSAYYPFGMSFQKGGIANKYLYNGKELQEDQIGKGNLDWYDYGARFYDAALGRFHTIDPKTETYSFQSPYVYANNNPIYYIDENGEGAKTTIEEDEEGNRKAVIEATITIYQQEGGKIDLAAFAKTLSKSLNSQFNVDGATVSILDPENGGKRTDMAAEFKFTVNIHEGTPEELAKTADGNEKMGQNYFMVYEKGEGEGTMSHALGGNSGVLQSDVSDKRVWGHEMGHMLGFKPQGGKYGGHTETGLMAGYQSAFGAGKVDQSMINQLNGGKHTGNGEGFGFGIRNYIYKTPTGKPINSKNYWPSNNVFKRR